MSGAVSGERKSFYKYFFKGGIYKLFIISLSLLLTFQFGKKQGFLFNKMSLSANKKILFSGLLAVLLILPVNKAQDWARQLCTS